MSGPVRHGALAAAFLLAAGLCASANARPELTGIGPSDCRALDDVEQTRRGVRGESVLECPAVQGAELFVVDNGGQVWLVIGWRGRLWPLIPAMVRHAPGENLTLGSAPSAEGTRTAQGRVEWWLGGAGAPEALTFRISGQDRRGRASGETAC